MMSVWLDLKCLANSGNSFVFESCEGGSERDERLQEEDSDEEWWDGEDDGRWKEEIEIEDVEMGEFW